MIKFTKKLAIAASLVTLSAGYFDALASDGELTPLELESPPVQSLALADTVAPTLPEHVKKGFFSEFPMDIKLLIARHVSESNNNVLTLAQVNKGWHYFMLGAEFI